MAETTETINYIRIEVLPVLREHGEKLSEINERLARQNQRIAHTEERGKAHSQRLDACTTDMSTIRAEVRALQAVSEVQSDQQRSQRDKLWAVGVEVAKLASAGGVAALVVKAIELLS